MSSISLFFFNDTATTEIYTLSLHDALPISRRGWALSGERATARREKRRDSLERSHRCYRSEEHTSELQSQSNLVCRLLLEKTNRCSCCSCGSAASPPPPSP